MPVYPSHTKSNVFRYFLENFAYRLKRIFEVSLLLLFHMKFSVHQHLRRVGLYGGGFRSAVGEPGENGREILSTSLGSR